MLRKSILLLLALVFALAPGLAGAQKGAKIATISALEALQMLRQDSKTTFLVDVRTRSQYTLLGHPPQAYNVPWHFAGTDFQVKGGPYHGGKAGYTGYQLSPESNPDFLGVVQSLFKPGDRIIIISCQGKLGEEAAEVLAKAGFKKVYNIRHGFSGDQLASKDQDKLAEKLSPFYGLRGRVNGWLFWGLPVSHQVDPRYIYPPDLKRMQTLK